MKRTASRKPLDRVRRKPDEEEQKARLRREVVSLINGGKISKEMQIITSNGVASIDDPNVLDMLKSKYPDRGRAIPGIVTWGQCVDNLAGLGDCIEAGAWGLS